MDTFPSHVTVFVPPVTMCLLPSTEARLAIAFHSWILKHLETDSIPAGHYYPA
jgi:hypothetical protein